MGLHVSQTWKIAYVNGNEMVPPMLGMVIVEITKPAGSEFAPAVTLSICVSLSDVGWAAVATPASNGSTLRPMSIRLIFTCFSVFSVFRERSSLGVGFWRNRPPGKSCHPEPIKLQRSNQVNRSELPAAVALILTNTYPAVVNSVS